MGRRFRTEWVAIVHYSILLTIALVGFYWQWHDMFLLPPDALSAIALIVVPCIQWVAVFVALGIGHLLESHAG